MATKKQAKARTVRQAQTRRVKGKTEATKPATPKPKPQEQPVREETRKPRVFAGPCPQSPNHKQTRVYKTLGKTRYCVCDDCGHTWKVMGPPAKAA